MAPALVVNSPFDIMLRLPWSALHSISCDFATEPHASMFCTAKTRMTKTISTAGGAYLPCDTYAQCSAERALGEIHSWFVELVCRSSRGCGKTYDVSRRFESAALCSFTCAFCVAQN